MESNVDERRAERIAHNEAAFRRANEVIRDRAADVGRTQSVPFICECGDEKCFARVELSIAEYEEVRSDSVHFLVKRGHEITGPNLGRVIETRGDYTLLQKVGVSGEIAEARDPRADGQGEAVS